MEFTKYIYRPELTMSENRRLAIAFHERDEPLVAVYRRDDDPQSGVSHFLFSDGATLDRDPLTLVEGPYDPPRPGREHTEGGRYEETQRNRLLYWRLRTQRAHIAFQRYKRLLTQTNLLTESNIERLEELQHQWVRCNDAWKKVIEEVNPPPSPGRPLTEAEQAELRKRRQKQHELEQQLQSITITDDDDEGGMYC